MQPPAPSGRTTLYSLRLLPGPHPLTARRLAAVAAADGRGLRADDPHRGALVRPPHVLGGRDRYVDARYTGPARSLWPTRWASSGVWPPRGPLARSLSCRDRLPARGARGPLAHQRHGPSGCGPCGLETWGRARGRSGVLLLCPSRPPVPAGLPCGLPHASEANRGFHALSTPYDAQAAGSAEGAAPLSL